MIEADKHTLGQPINASEIEKSTKSLKDKAPGPDSFTAAFYKTYSEQLKPTMLKVFNHIGNHGITSDSMMEATIIVIPKEGKDPALPKNYRPISLINVDCKMYANILATRLNTVLPHLISNSQVGFLRTRV